MEYLKQDELLNVEGGKALVEGYEALKDWVLNSMDDFIDGLVDGWNSR